MIVWDLGGVVARFLPERRCDALAVAAQMSPAEVEGAIVTHGLGADADSGRLTSDEVWIRATAAFNGLGRDIIRKCWALAFEPDPAVLSLLDDQPHRAALLTDNGPILEACLEHELAPVAARFDPCLFSWRLGATKPTSTAFERAARRLDRKPIDLVLVDDRPDNVAGAIAAGWAGLQFQDITTTAAALATIPASRVP